ncbi:MAG TPA: cytochrome c oxidase subunit 3 [Bacteroidales bacterium]|jgi:nitric oxide reductase NorE protein|nr:cytochrome c oxidase subunit 3 [Bacteroidia bacterium]HMM12172.1 cytochrome c oxidase subunit 3 [Bacteroidales bacterium]
MKRVAANIAYPPGGLLIWIIIIVELMTFGLALIGFGISSLHERQSFVGSTKLLDRNAGFVNTLLLLSSGFFMAVAVQNVREGKNRPANSMMLMAMLTGTLFVLIKGIEYNSKLTAGIGLYYNTFFLYYWLLTGFHLVHVLAGLVIIVVAIVNNLKGKLSMESMEATASFWHMCDLIWLVLFPLLYLIQW